MATPRHTRPWLTALPWMVIAVSVAALSAGVVCAQDGLDCEHRQALAQLESEGLSEKDRRAALDTLSNGLHNEGQCDWILVGLRAPLQKDPHAIDELLPRLAEFLKHARENNSETRLCKFLDLLLLVGHAPPEVIEELEAVHRSSRFRLAGPRAAAQLLAIDSDRAELIEWFGDRLQSKDSQERATAASALGAAGKRVAPVLPKLRPLLQDPQVQVRVAAARAVWQISPGNGDVVGVLRNSLAIPAVDMEFTTPWTISALGPNHHQAALSALWRMGASAVPAADDIAKLLKDADISTRCLAAQALGAIGARTPAVLQALEEATRDEHPDVAAASAEALKILKIKKDGGSRKDSG